MFDNQVTLNDGSVETIVSITDTDNGTTTRSINLGGGNRLSLVTARSESKENPGILSDRILVRLDKVKTEVASPYSPTKLSVYLVQVVPQRPDVLAADVHELVASLFNFFLPGGPELTAASVSATLDRLLAGET